MNDCDIRLEKFSETDFDTLIFCVKGEKELIKFAGPIFSFSLTKEQLRDYLADIQRHASRIIYNDTNTTIGHCEVYKTDDQNSRT